MSHGGTPGGEQPAPVWAAGPRRTDTAMTGVSAARETREGASRKRRPAVGLRDPEKASEVRGVWDGRNSQVPTRTDALAWSDSDSVSPSLTRHLPPGSHREGRTATSALARGDHGVHPHHTPGVCTRGRTQARISGELLPPPGPSALLGGHAVCRRR